MYNEPTGVWWYLLIWGIPTLGVFLGAWLPLAFEAAQGAHPEDAGDPPATGLAVAAILFLAAGSVVALAEGAAALIIPWL